MADKEDQEYLRLHLHDYRKENGYVFGFFEADLKEFLEEYMSSNSSCFVLSERHSKEDNHKRYSSTGTVCMHGPCMYFMISIKDTDTLLRSHPLEGSCLIEVACFMGFLRN